MLPLILADRLFCLKQAGPSGNADRLERRADSEADRLVGPGWIRHEQVGLQGIIAAGYALDGRVEGFHVDRNINFYCFRDFRTAVVWFASDTVTIMP